MDSTDGMEKAGPRFLRGKQSGLLFVQPKNSIFVPRYPMRKSMKSKKKFVCRVFAMLVWAGWSGTAWAAGPADTLEQVSVDRKVVLPVKKNNRVEFTLHVDFPSDTHAHLKRNMTGWIDGLLSTLTGVKGPDETPASTPERLIGYYEKEYLKKSRDEIVEILKLREKGTEHPVNYVVDMSVKRRYETSRLITYSAEAYLYGGGAHGMTYTVYVSFRKNDGRQLTWDDLVVPKMKKTFSTWVADGVMRYFGMTDFENLRGNLLIEKPYSRTSFPLPAGGPGLLADGLRVQYALYEIAPYAAGAPSVTIPYAQLQKVLTPVAKQLLK